MQAPVDATMERRDSGSFMASSQDIEPTDRGLAAGSGEAKEAEPWPESPHHRATKSKDTAQVDPEWVTLIQLWGGRKRSERGKGG